MGELHVHEALAAPAREANRTILRKRKKETQNIRVGDGESAGDVKCGPGVSPPKALPHTLDTLCQGGNDSLGQTRHLSPALRGWNSNQELSACHKCGRKGHDDG